MYNVTGSISNDNEMIPIYCELGYGSYPSYF